ncbi:MAG: group 1 truncated hemoglobin [Halieaceae bacterium]|nr:group 1 truncated hemoglobin [Halieaceae bacterium]
MTGHRAVCGLVRSSYLVAITAIMLGCQSAPPSDSLYQDLGGLAGITRVADNFLYHLGRDDRVIDFFAESDIDRFHEKVIEHICELSGGPCEYTGDSMLETHRGMGINDTQFNAVVEDLILAMEDAGLGTTAQNRLLSVLAPLHQNIVEH